jgi:6-phosphogluconolactonase/glucosamine-6-phosphate isomerase/deaminase
MNMEMDTENEINTKAETPFTAPDTKYFHTRKEFDRAVAKDFIKNANKVLEKGEKFLVGLSHGQSPAGAYQYIFDNYSDIVKPENIIYTFVNSQFQSQRDLTGVTDASSFIRKLYKAGYIKRQQILGSAISRQSLDSYTKEFNATISKYMLDLNKEGLDYVFLACNPEGRVAGIERTSKAFDSKELAVLVSYKKDKEMTVTPHFLKQSKRIAFLATKADKRRPLAWLYATNGKENESPSFLRHIDKVEKRLTVFIDDKALTWPQLEVIRETPYGPSVIRVDTANAYKPNAKEKLPVVVMVHGFLGLNSFDGLLSTLPSQKYIAAAMHYGSIPNDLPPSEYSYHIAKNIEAVVDYFGENGHPVYLFDHSMGNIYFMMIDRELNKFPAIKKHLRGRIGANPFYGEEAKHALLGFLDTVILPSISPKQSLRVRTMLIALRSVIPFDTKSGVRKRGINLSDWLIKKDSEMREKIWAASKERILELMTNMDSLPHLNRIPIENALNRLPAKVFAIQTHSALEQSIVFDKQQGLQNFPKYNIPVLILKSENDGVAKYVPRFYVGRNIEVMDVTNVNEHDLFREHLFHMVYPEKTTQIIDNFIERTEVSRKTAEN